MTPNYYDVKQIQDECIDLNVNDIVNVNGTNFIVKEKTLEASIDAPVIVKYQLQEVGYPSMRFDRMTDNFMFEQPREIEFRQFAQRPHFGDFQPEKTTTKRPIEEVSEEARQEFLKLLE